MSRKKKNNPSSSADDRKTLDGLARAIAYPKSENSLDQGDIDDVPSNWWTNLESDAPLTAGLPTAIAQKKAPQWNNNAEIPLQRDQQRTEGFYRQYLHLPTRCEQNQCKYNREFDPFCLCHMEKRIAITSTSNSTWQQRQGSTPAGLRNLGNTCYMNSYLQTLYHILPIRRTLYEWRLPPPENRNPSKHYSLVKELRNLFARLQMTMERAVSPRDLVKTAGLNAALQQDAHEFSVLFLDWLDQVIAEKPGEEKLQRLFKGATRSVIKCRTCSTASIRDNDFYNIGLQSKDVSDIITSLLFYFADEQIDGYDCQTCGVPRTADKETRLTKLPRFLNLHLNRLLYDRVTHSAMKLSHPVEYPRILDLRSFLTADQVKEWGEIGCQYELMAVLIHLGGAGGGHYLARIRVATHGRWFTFNDDSVHTYSDQEYPNDIRNAYMLVYEKRKDVERNPTQPPMPKYADLPGYGLQGDWQPEDFHRLVGDVSKGKFLDSLKVKPDSVILWAPTDWLASVFQTILNGPKGQLLPTPDLSRFLCVHGRLAHFRGLKALDSVQAEKLFDALAVAPFPFFVDGSMMCEDCAANGMCVQTDYEGFPLW